MSPKSIEPSYTTDGLGIAVVTARFNSYVTHQMRDLAIKRLQQLGISDSSIVSVSAPGAFELPLLARHLANRGDIDAVICLGAVIKGETDHYDHVAFATTEGISTAGSESGKPVIFGILTTDNTDQAIARISHARDYADAAVEMANNIRQIQDLA
ncbi:MAG: 6,7-dimethyl-8-ribityllumazine synthase [Chloroflexota bacterium]|jgi:6,7-dimethyl-8-ribityllumazine synthase